jgi:hypothetical protein
MKNEELKLFNAGIQNAKCRMQEVDVKPTQTITEDSHIQHPASSI